MTKLEALTEEALALDLKSRAHLAAVLLQSVDEGLSEAEIEALWAEEAERRAADTDAGNRKLQPGDEVMARARKMAG